MSNDKTPEPGQRAPKWYYGLGRPSVNSKRASLEEAYKSAPISERIEILRSLRRISLKGPAAYKSINRKNGEIITPITDAGQIAKLKAAARVQLMEGISAALDQGDDELLAQAFHEPSCKDIQALAKGIYKGLKRSGQKNITIKLWWDEVCRIAQWRWGFRPTNRSRVLKACGLKGRLKKSRPKRKLH